MPPARYQDAMFERNRQLLFLQSDVGMRYMTSFEESMRQKDYGSDKFSELPQGIIYRTAYQTVLQGDPIYVHDHVVDVIDHAREHFLPEVVLPTDPFCAAGFAWLARSIAIRDTHNKSISVRAIGWIPVRAADEDGMEKGGLWVTFWTHYDDVTDYSDGIGRQVFDANKNGALTALHSFFLAFNRKMWEDVDEPAYMEASIRQWTTVQVMWRLGQQFVKTDTQPQRQARKESHRLRVQPKAITVITLRRERDGYEFNGEGEGGKYYHVQFMVRGHWRNQWYPSLKEHRQKWIHPYVKGDPDDPFQQTERVFDFKR